jgi:hypothetical protein
MVCLRVLGGQIQEQLKAKTDDGAPPVPAVDVV